MTSLTIYEKLEIHLSKSKLESDVVERILSNFKQNIFCVDDIFQIVVADEHETLSFITKTLFNSMDFEYKNKLYHVFSVVCDKIVLLNLSGSDSWNLCLKLLISYQYNKDVNGGQMYTNRYKIIYELRIDLITRCVDIIMDSVSPQDHYQCDDKFLFLLKTISKNLFLMGRPSAFKYRLMDQKFPIDDMRYSLNIFIMIHRKNHANMNIFKLALNKIDIMRMLERFQLNLRDHNEKYNSALLESYYELTELETNMEHFTGKKLELFWRLKMLPPTNSISFPQLMTKLNKILTHKIMTEERVLIIKESVKRKLEKCTKWTVNLELLKNTLHRETKNVTKRAEIKYKDMLAMYYVTSNCGNKNNKITRYIRSAEEREIRTPFDRFAFTLCLILKSDFYVTPEMEDWRNEIQKNIKERHPRVQQRLKSSNKKFCRRLKRNTNRIKNIFALGNIRSNITAALEVDVQNCDELGFLVIRRALHVIGEFTKCTRANQNISIQLSDYMKSVHQCLSVSSPQNLRNKLSHNYSLYRIKRMDGLKRADYKDMQSDLQSLNYIFSTMHSFCIPNIVKQFNGTLYNCKSDIEANSLLEYINEIRGVILQSSPYSSDIMNILNDVQKNIIPTLNSVAMEDPRRQENLLTWIENLITITSEASSKTTRSSIAFKFHWQKYIMKFSNLIKLRKYLKQFLHSNKFSLSTSYFQYGHEIFVLYRHLNVIYSLLIHGEEKDKYEFIWEKIFFVMSTIREKYAFFLKIDQMKQFLDLEENNPALELDILRTLDAIYEELGVSPIELQKHDDHPRAMEVLMQALSKHTSIFKINNKYEALEEYFKPLGAEINSRLKDIKTKEEKYIQQFLNDKISLASKIGERPRFERGIEMLLLEILDILCVRNIENNWSQLDQVFPVLCGLNMRNYLAHGNISYEVTTLNAHTTPIVHTLYNLKIINCLPEDHFKLFDLRSDIIEVPKFKNDWNFDEQLKFIDIQTQLNDSVRTLNITKLRFASRKGAFFNGRDHRGHNIFEVFLKHNLQIYEQYETDKSTLSTEELEFIEEFFSSLPSNFRLNAKYPRKPRNIFKEAEEAIANGFRDAIETDILQFACASGSVETVKMIINSNLDFNLNRKNKDNDIPLKLACFFSWLDIISLLLGKIEIIDLDENLCNGLAISNDIRVFQMVIPKCRDYNTTMNMDLSSLWFMAVTYECDLNIITYLIDNGANKAHRNARGDTMIHMAVLNKRVDVVKYLIANGFDCNVKNNNSNTPLGSACFYGYLEIIEILLEFCEIDTEIMNYCLGSAMQNNHNDIAIMLFQKWKEEIDQSVINEILIFAIGAKNHKIVEFFIKELKLGFNFDELFHYSIISNEYTIFEVLLNSAEKQHISLNQKTLDQLIMRAASYNNFQIIEKLIKMGADYTQRNRNINGSTTLHSLALSPPSDTIAVRFVLTLENPGLNAVDNEGNTPLYYAITEDNIITAFILLKAGADVKIQNIKKLSMFHVACWGKNIEMVKLLVRYGAAEQIHWKDLDGNTPLDLAAKDEQDEALIQYLGKLSTGSVFDTT